MAVLTPVVHTTGINWDSVAAIVGIVSGVIATFAIIAGWLGRMFAKYITTQITGSINRFRIEVVATLEHRLTHLEDMVDRNKRDDSRDR